MPLSSSTPRNRIHTRTIECVGYEREDGLWDIEGHLTDLKTQPLTRPESGLVIEPGTPTHDMWVRLTIDTSLVVQHIEVVMDARRFPICSEVLPNFKKLEGLTIGRGFNKAIQNIVGDVHGCTHLRELIGRMATTAYQTTNRARVKCNGYHNEKIGRQLVGTCVAYSSDSQMVLERWPHLYTGGRKNPPP